MIIIRHIIQLILFISIVNAEMEVNKTTIYKDENIKLIISSNNNFTTNREFLDGIEKHFEIINNSSFSDISIKNGTRRSKYSNIYVLQAKSSGILEIPSLDINGEIMPSIKIEVIDELSDRGKKIQDDMFMTINISDPNPFIQQQVIITQKLMINESILDQVRLYANKDISINDAIVFPIEKESQGRAIINNISYFYYEKRYAVFPQKSGELVIKSPVMSFMVEEENMSSYMFGTSSAGRKIYNISDKEDKYLNVKSSIFNDDWYPAKDMKIIDNWSGVENIKQGNSISRKVVIEANGLLAENLPNIEFIEDNKYKVYVSSPVMKNKSTIDGIISTKEYSITYIPILDGRLELPSINFKWWNTTIESFEDINIPPKILEVQKEVIDTRDDAIVDSNIIDENNNYLSFSNSRWFWISIIFLILWITTLAIFMRSRKSSKNRQKINTAKILSQKEILSNIKISCNNNNPSDAYKNTLLFLNTLGFKDKIVNLLYVYDFIPSELKDSFNNLNLATYNSHKKQEWNGQEFWLVFSNNYKNIRTAILIKDKDLPNL